MKLTIEQINKLKEYGFITQVDPSSDILSHSIDTVELGKIWKYINQTDRTEIIEEWLNSGPTPTNDYLTFDILSDGRIYWVTTISGTGSHEPDYYKKTIQYSKDGGNTWTPITSSIFGPGDMSYIEVSTGDTLLVKGNNSHYAEEELGEGFFFTSTQFTAASDITPEATPTLFNIKGNIMSLIGGDDFDNILSLNDPHTFDGLFGYNSGLIDASQLILPATTLTEGCYSDMFEDCTSLTTAPSLPATTLAEDCYSSMFYGCTSLTTAPSLPATTLAEDCYSSMFYGCTSLTTAPSLPATTLVSSCYQSMFSGCTSLVTAPEISATAVADGADGSCMTMFMSCTSLTTAPSLHITDLSGSVGCYKQMFDGCTSLTTAPSLPATTLTSSCYAYMFKGCTSLTTAPTISIYELPERCCEYMFQNCTSLNHVTLNIEHWGSRSTYYWLDNVSPTGTFVGSAAVINAWDASRSESSIPAGWTTEIIQSDDSPEIDPPDSPIFS